MKFTLKSKTTLAVTLGLALWAFQPAMAFNGGEDPVKKTKSRAKEKSFASLNNQSVKIYPDAFTRDMHVVAKDNDDKLIDFFVFDMQGTLLHNYKMKSRDHYKISGLKKGIYLYRVFAGDEETASGKFEVR